MMIVKIIRDWLFIIIAIIFLLVFTILLWGAISIYDENPFGTWLFGSASAIIIVMLIYWLRKKWTYVKLAYLEWKTNNQQIKIIRETKKQRLVWEKKKLLQSELDSCLRKALMIMDSTAKIYNSEEEANRELITCLRTMEIPAEYQYRLANGRIVDGKVGNILIEGKLSPRTEDIDRLIGQLSEYTRYGTVNIVIYGLLTEEARWRIESEIVNKYLNKAFLTYLDNPKRHRREKLFNN